MGESLVAPTLAWRILDFGRIRQNVLAAEARAERAYAAFEETLLLAIEEAENGLAGYRAATQTAAELAVALEESRTAAELARSLSRSEKCQTPVAVG